MKKIVKIEGMMCEHCSKRVENALTSLNNSIKVKVELKNNQAIIKGEIEDSLIKETLEKINYKVLDIITK